MVKGNSFSPEKSDESIRLARVGFTRQTKEYRVLRPWGPEARASRAPSGHGAKDFTGFPPRGLGNLVFGRLMRGWRNFALWDIMAAGGKPGISGPLAPMALLGLGLRPLEKDSQ